MSALTLPKVPLEALRKARVCPTQLTQSPVGPYAMCAAANELLPEEQAHAEALLAPYFPTGTKFEFFWPVGRGNGRTAAEWFSELVARYQADG